MALSLTDRLQHERVTVVEVDRDAGRLRIKGETCTDLSCHERTVVITEDDAEANLDTLNPGDVVRIDASDRGVARIVVLRRVWEQIASPEL